MYFGSFVFGFAVKWIGVALHKITMICPLDAFIITLTFHGTEVVASDIRLLHFKKFNYPDDYPFDGWCMPAGSCPVSAVFTL
jgi:hypothetical protein